MKGWQLEYETFDPSEEGIRESLCALGNGYFVTRGAAEEAEVDHVHYPGTYLAGGYNRLKSDIAGHVIENEDLVNCPNWLSFRFRIENDPWFHIRDVKVISYHQSLHIKEGILTRILHFLDEKGRETKMKTRRLVSMHNPHLAALEVKIEPINWEAEIEVLAALDGRVKNLGVERYRELEYSHLEPLETDVLEGEEIYLQVRTNQSHLHIAQAALLNILGKEVQKEISQETGYVAQTARFQVKKGEEVTIEKIVSLFSSKDHAISECGLEAREEIKKAGSFSDIYEKHQLAWKHLWERFDIEIEVEHMQDEVLCLTRLHIFHMLQTTSLHSRDLDVGVPPRGWHGEAYRGHILWDELFVFSTLNLQIPELTRALLLYRYRRLPAAREAAKNAGFHGAMYPWQSGSNGREESQKVHLNPLSGQWIPDNSSLQRHVNGAIAYNVWQYFEATGDLEFLSFYGAEILFEIARFFVSLTTFNQETRKYEILRVMGPDEYHDGYPGVAEPGINNNTYTNVLVAWLLSRALQALETLPEDRVKELKETLHLNGDELEKWDLIRKKLFIPFHDGVVSQFQGYELLKELDWEKYKNVQRLDRTLDAEGDHPNHYKASKQADVLMLFFLFSAEELRAIFDQLGYPFEPDRIQKTIDYYIKRTSHGSTLSRVVHSWILSRSDRKLSWELFFASLKSDFVDIQGGTTAEGIHLGAMAGTIDLLQRCYVGVEYRGHTLRFNPSLPQELTSLRTVLRYRGHTLLVQVNHNTLTITSKKTSAKPIQIAFEDQTFTLEKGESKELSLETKNIAPR